jgi:hypothetical protein
MPLPPPPPGFQINGARPALPRVIMGPPKEPAPQTPAQAGLDTAQVENARKESILKGLQIEKAHQEANDARTKQQAQARAIPETVHDLINVIDAASNAHRLSRRGWFTTGFGSEIASKFPGSSARDEKGLLDTIASNTAFSRLQQMRDQSPTGGALGAISERELALLQSTIASLDQGQSDEQFQSNMRKIIGAYGRVVSKLPGGKQALQSWRTQKEGRPAAPAARSGGGWKPPPGVSIEPLD